MPAELIAVARQMSIFIQKHLPLYFSAAVLKWLEKNRFFNAIEIVDTQILASASSVEVAIGRYSPVSSEEDRLQLQVSSKPNTIRMALLNEMIHAINAAANRDQIILKKCI